MQINRDNMEQLKDAAERFASAWESIEDAVEAWVGFQDDPPTDADGKEERKEAREEIDSGIEDVESAVSDLASLFGTKKPAAKKR